jgi:hypothetical protein
MPANNQPQYPLLALPSGKRGRFRRQLLAGVGIVGVAVLAGLFFLPKIVTVQVQQEQAAPIPATATQFPVSVNPATKSITYNPAADAFFTSKTSDLTASVDTVGSILSWIATLIDDTRLYQSLAAANSRLITILPGYRKEQVAAELAKALNWNAAQQQEFLTDVTAQTPGITDGIFSPGTYVVDTSMTPSNVAALMSVAFNKNILVHYSSTTAQQVPLSEALTIASLLEREAKGPSDMRIISGIIWNRLFNNMNLQIDATLQYAMGVNTKGNWWQQVVPKDKYISSAYNTYAHPGLPPGPIANPSVAAVLAALNPVQTSCLYYFHDSKGNFHCSDTYTQHVALLKKYYGQGK